MKAEALTSTNHPAPARGAETQNGERPLCARPETREHLRGLVYQAWPDVNLAEDLVQEGLLACWREERKHPGRTTSWYEGRSFLSIRDSLRKGRSVDSLKRRGAGRSLDELAKLDRPAEGDAFQVICARDAFEVLRGQLGRLGQRILQFLSEEWGVEEIARAMHIRPATVIEQRRLIRAVALSLGICPARAELSAGRGYLFSPDIPLRRPSRRHAKL